MKRVTFRVEENLITRARDIARSQGRTLNAAFREWLVDFTESHKRVQEYEALMKKLSKSVRAKGPYTRDEMNER